MVAIEERALAELIRQNYVSIMRPPPPARDLITFVRTLKNPKGEYAKLPYDPALHPAHMFFLAAVVSGTWKNFLIVADTQSGKSWLIQCVVFYSLCELKVDVLYGLPNMRFASDVWMGKIRESMQLAGLGQFLPRSGSGSGGGTDIDTIYLHMAAALSFFGAGGHRGGGGNDGRTIPVIANDELDSLPKAIINKNDARADAYFRQARRFKSTTVKDDDDSNGLNFLKESTNARLEYPCPSCSLLTPLDFEQLHYDATSDATAKATARMTCARCGDRNAFDEQRRQDALRDPRARLAMNDRYYSIEEIMVGPESDNDFFGLRWTCFDNPFKSLGEKIAVKHRRAVIESNLGRTKDLIDFYHDDLARQFPREESELNLDAVRLAQRSQAADAPRGVVPTAAIFVTVAVDQQKRVLAWLVKAHAADGRTWRIDWGLENICGPRDEPTREQRKESYTALEAKLKQGWDWQGHERRMFPVVIGIDVADWPDIAAEWMRGKSLWMPLHGAGAEMVQKMTRSEGKDIARLPGWYQIREQKAHGGEWRIMWLDHDEIKHELTRSFARPVNTSGSAMLPRGLSAEDGLIQHLTSERWEKNAETGKVAWIKHGRYNDWWDDDYYTQALGQWWMTEHPNYQPRELDNTPARDPDDDNDSGFGTLGSW